MLNPLNYLDWKPKASTLLLGHPDYSETCTTGSQTIIGINGPAGSGKTFFTTWLLSMGIDAGRSATSKTIFDAMKYENLPETEGHTVDSFKARPRGRECLIVAAESVRSVDPYVWPQWAIRANDFCGKRIGIYDTVGFGSESHVLERVAETFVLIQFTCSIGTAGYTSVATGRRGNWIGDSRGPVTSQFTVTFENSREAVTLLTPILESPLDMDLQDKLVAGWATWQRESMRELISVLISHVEPRESAD